MDLLYTLVPFSLVLLGIAIVVFFWAVRSGQFDDMDSPAHRILFDEDDNGQKSSDADTSISPKKPK
ncbi:cbb3-type cytochrome oxidase assembly protein CcoS [Parathalassolituus penaei]|uniref:Cbb3-type cytochrome oxidase assembly protein CcoS n=1 Tax=Parathalassolituus penaei TaxID=2997323 RepID=A0A9X3EHV2_9GAMM|nr:cbb3-type cytochrome oxidase assembly protein CcoS [Parathalassolituus penaei]MCY0964516.1 cbb3-type cytochrome oxidase assembly protein CcoS [Parathalassolituus penaei]